METQSEKRNTRGKEIYIRKFINAKFNCLYWKQVGWLITIISSTNKTLIRLWTDSYLHLEASSFSLCKWHGLFAMTPHAPEAWGLHLEAAVHDKYVRCHSGSLAQVLLKFLDDSFQEHLWELAFIVIFPRVNKGRSDEVLFSLLYWKMGSCHGNPSLGRAWVC